MKDVREVLGWVDWLRKVPRVGGGWGGVKVKNTGGGATFIHSAAMRTNSSAKS